jgi:hypothetical protein
MPVASREVLRADMATFFCTSLWLSSACRPVFSRRKVSRVSTILIPAVQPQRHSSDNSSTCRVSSPAPASTCGNLWETQHGSHPCEGSRRACTLQHASRTWWYIASTISGTSVACRWWWGTLQPRSISSSRPFHMDCWSGGSAPGSALRRGIPVTWRMEKELCGAFTGIHIAGPEGIEKCFVLYRPPSELPRKVGRDQEAQYHRHGLHLAIQ